MDMIAVRSSNIESVGYDAPRQLLYIKFLSGATYEYQTVPLQVYRDFMAAESKGAYHARHIRLSYPYRRLRYIDRA